VRLCFMSDIVLLIDRLYCIDLFSCIAASLFNKLTYLLTYLLTYFLFLIRPFPISRSAHSFPNSSSLFPLHLARTSGKHYKLPALLSKKRRPVKKVRGDQIHLVLMISGGSVAEWLVCWTQSQRGPGSNCSRDAVG